MPKLETHAACASVHFRHLERQAQRLARELAAALRDGGLGALLRRRPPGLFLTPGGPASDARHAQRAACACRPRDPHRSRRGDARNASVARGTPPPPSAPLAEGDESLFPGLRSHRLALAREAGVAPYVIASDRSLRDLAAPAPA
jgi:superfamily II DNA helicase RecQ